MFRAMRSLSREEKYLCYLLLQYNLLYMLFRKELIGTKLHRNTSEGYYLQIGI